MRPPQSAHHNMKVAIVIPILNEASSLPAMMDHWDELRRAGASLTMVDGGSTDQTLRILEERGFQVLSGPKGRALQMNQGAGVNPSDILLFLHADTILPYNAIPAIQGAFRTSPRVWGRFDVKVQGKPWMLKVVGRMINLRSRLSGIATGDQAIFVRSEEFFRIGMFPEQALMEDVEISRRLLRVSRPVCIAQKASTSGRRWETRGVWSTIFLMWRLRWSYWRGVSPQELARLYR